MDVHGFCGWTTGNMVDHVDGLKLPEGAGVFGPGYLINRQNNTEGLCTQL